MRIASALPSNSSDVTAASAALYPPNNRLVGPRQHTAGEVVRFPVARTSPHQRAAGLLTSWKNIAAYLDRGVRTVQRWERMLKLPVHRVGTGQLAPVFAYQHEIDHWLQQTRTGRQQLSTSTPISRTQLDSQPQWLVLFYNDLLQNVLQLERAVETNQPAPNVNEALLRIQTLVQTTIAHAREARKQVPIHTNRGANRPATNRSPLSDQRSLA
ncbi:MAG: hypothetical protein WA477_20185 [Candidatus Sulfotelmatobacter sp.]